MLEWFVLDIIDFYQIMLTDSSPRFHLSVANTLCLQNNGHIPTSSHLLDFDQGSMYYFKLSNSVFRITWHGDPFPWTQACEWGVYFTESHALRWMATAIMNLNSKDQKEVGQSAFSGKSAFNGKSYPWSELRISFKEFANRLKTEISIDALSQPCSTLNTHMTDTIETSRESPTWLEILNSGPAQVSWFSSAIHW